MPLGDGLTDLTFTDPRNPGGLAQSSMASGTPGSKNREQSPLNSLSPQVIPSLGLPSQGTKSGTANPRDLDAAAMSMYQDNSARMRYMQALKDFSNKPPADVTGGINVPLLQFAAGLLKPTNTGSFTEALSQAAPPALQSQLAIQKANQDSAENRDITKLKLLGEEADNERSSEDKLFQLMLSKYNKNPIHVVTKEGVYLIHPDGHRERIGDPMPNGTMINQYEKKEDINRADRDDAFYKDIIKQGEASQRQSQTLDAFTALMNQDHYEGEAAPWLNKISSFAKTFGVERPFGLPSSSPGEAMRGLSARLTMDAIGGSLGTGISNADRDFIANEVLRFGNTDAANKIMANVLTKLNDRNKAIYQFSLDYEAEHGDVKGLKQAIMKQFGSQKLFDDDFKKQARQYVDEAGGMKDRLSEVERQQLQLDIAKERERRKQLRGE